MRRLGLLVLILCAPLLGSSTVHAAQPSAKEWRADVRTEMRGSLDFLERRAARGGKLAINLDIDNTMLATEYAAGTPVRPVLRFAQRARELGMKVFVNSARARGRRDETLAELAAAGYAIDGLCLRRAHEPATASKPRCRARFTGRGYRLVANVGNNPTDFAGSGGQKDYQRAYRLPNYRGRLS